MKRWAIEERLDKLVVPGECTAEDIKQALRYVSDPSVGDSVNCPYMATVLQKEKEDNGENR